MTEMLTGAPAKNYVGGEWRESVAGETYEKRNPWRPSEVTGVFQASDAEDARVAIAREKQLKRWPRARKVRLIEQGNVGWLDLAVDWYPDLRQSRRG